MWRTGLMHQREETRGTQRTVQLFIKHELKAVTMVIPYPIPSTFFSPQTFRPRVLAPSNLAGCQLTFGTFSAFKVKMKISWKRKKNVLGELQPLNRKLVVTSVITVVSSPSVVCLTAELLPTSQISARYAAAGVSQSCFSY